MADSVACPHCGAANPVGSQFCAACGKATPASDGGPRVASLASDSLSVSSRAMLAEGLKAKLRHASIALLVVAIMQTIFGPVVLWVQKSQMEAANPGVVIEIAGWAYVVIYGLAAAFWGLWFWSRKAPLAASIVGLVLFVTMHTLDAAVDPAALLRGILVKIVVVVVLIKAVQAGVQYKRLRDQAGALGEAL